MKLTLNHIALFAVTCIALGLAYILVTNTQTVQGSVSVSNDYYATTTSSNGSLGATVSTSRVIKAGYGSLGSVVITGANTGVVALYNATTSNILARTGNKATSTLLLASLPASAAAGTYTFDVWFTDGLFIDLNPGTGAGVMPTTTITYR